MGRVNIPVTVTNSGLQTPARGIANRDNQHIVWTIANAANSGITFPTPPFSFPSPPPAGFDPWPATADPVTAGPGTNQWQTHINFKVPVGDPPQIYKYDINYTEDGIDKVMDPDIENQGVPPGSTEDEDDDGRPRGGGKGPGKH
jgi:hypothetical protein